MSRLAWVGILGMVLSLGAPAFGGFINVDIDFNPPWSAPGHGHAGPPEWAKAPSGVVEMVGANHERANVRLNQALAGAGHFPVDFSGETDDDPILAISQTIENSTGFVWTGYEVTLDPEGTATFVAGSAGSDVFTNITEESYKILFSQPASVPVGGSVTLEFDILVPDIGPFGFTMTQTPIPEPASLALLALGAMGMLRRRR